ncbi:MAG: hypothetical protein M9918_15265 [Anaerolineae bacterium]|nr:hypothetical protein [Anaerolineae bacterium]MCO5192248.1 hypothetical protein [Anaerolineae bacterium]
MMEPEYITILEGPTPDFRPSPELWNLSVFEGPQPIDIAFCRLRTATGADIRARCTDAWVDGRAVQLDFPDEMRLRQQLDVAAMRLISADDGEELHLWLRTPLEIVNADVDVDDGFDEDDDEDTDFFGF